MRYPNSSVVTKKYSRDFDETGVKGLLTIEILNPLRLCYFLMTHDRPQLSYKVDSGDLFDPFVKTLNLYLRITYSVK